MQTKYKYYIAVNTAHGLDLETDINYTLKDLQEWKVGFLIDFDEDEGPMSWIDNITNEVISSNKLTDLIHEFCFRFDSIEDVNEYIDEHRITFLRKSKKTDIFMVIDEHTLNPIFEEVGGHMMINLMDPEDFLPDFDEPFIVDEIADDDLIIQEFDNTLLKILSKFNQGRLTANTDGDIFTTPFYKRDNKIVYGNNITQGYIARGLLCSKIVYREEIPTGFSVRIDTDQKIDNNIVHEIYCIGINADGIKVLDVDDVVYAYSHDGVTGEPIEGEKYVVYKDLQNEICAWDV